MGFKFLRGNGFAARLAAAGGRGKLASGNVRRHKGVMRYLYPLPILFVAACAPQPSATPAPQPVTASSATDQHDHRTVNGMTAADLIQHFGKPKLQIVEGQSTKLQFAGPNCVLDVYLYPPESGSGPARATLIEARNFQGTSVSAQSCAAAIESH